MRLLQRRRRGCVSRKSCVHRWKKNGVRKKRKSGDSKKKRSSKNARLSASATSFSLAMQQRRERHHPLHLVSVLRTMKGALETSSPARIILWQSGLQLESSGGRNLHKQHESSPIQKVARKRMKDKLRPSSQSSHRVEGARVATARRHNNHLHSYLFKSPKMFRNRIR